MESFRPDRRDLLLTGSAVALSALMPRAAWAQKINPGKILGGLPPEIGNVVNQVVGFDAVGIAASIIELEGTADLRKLPPSSLDLGKGRGFPASPDELYRVALPRLVALIDRFDAVDEGLATKASSVLAELHLSQHLIADGWSRLSLLTSTAISPSAITCQSAKKSTSFDSLREEYAQLYGSLEAKPQFEDSLAWNAKAMSEFRPRYEKVGSVTSVPWYFIGVIHCLEASFNFRAHLHNGDFPLSSRTRRVPAGKPSVWLPPSDWEASAKDALKLLGFAGQSDWGLERTLYRLEAYNGFGYRSRGVPTPYLWSYSNHYSRGKFVSDGKWSATAVSQQVGSAVLLKRLERDGVISFPPSI